MNGLSKHNDTGKLDWEGSATLGDVSGLYTSCRPLITTIVQEMYLLRLVRAVWLLWLCKIGERMTRHSRGTADVQISYIILLYPVYCTLAGCGLIRSSIELDDVRSNRGSTRRHRNGYARPLKSATLANRVEVDRYSTHLRAPCVTSF